MIRRLFITLSALLALHAATAQEKVLESSARKAPAWIGTTESEFIIVSAEETTLDAAQKRCLNDIRQSIVNAVCVNIRSEEALTERQTEDAVTSDIYRRYESQLKTVAGRLPFITGISLSDAETYWEKRYMKRDKSTYYLCHVRYPFPITRRNALIAEFLRQDRAQYARLTALKEQFDTFSRVEEIDRAITELEPLIAYFFDDMRRDEAQALQRNYRKLYTMISVVACGNELGEHTFCFTLNGRRVTTSRRPTIRSQWATGIVVTPTDEGLYRVTYNYEMCPDDTENSIELIYLLGGQAVRHSFTFDVRQDKMSVIPCGTLELDLTPHANAADSCATVTGWLDLRSKYEAPFEVTGLNLTAEGIGVRIYTDLMARFEGKSTHRLGFRFDGPFPITTRRAALAQGVITLRNVQTGESRDVRFALPYKIRIQ